jgi:uncharacterized protein
LSHHVQILVTESSETSGNDSLLQGFAHITPAGIYIRSSGRHGLWAWSRPAMTRDTCKPTTNRRRALLRVAWNIAGGVALLLGLIGVILPVLPTTPFVLLAAFCFSNGSQRMRHWLVTHAVFGPLIADWEAHGSIPRPVKRLACTVMAGVFAISLFAGVATTVLIIQAICLGGAAAYVLTRPDGPA